MLAEPPVPPAPIAEAFDPALEPLPPEPATPPEVADPPLPPAPMEVAASPATTAAEPPAPAVPPLFEPPALPDAPKFRLAPKAVLEASRTVRTADAAAVRRNFELVMSLRL